MRIFEASPLDWIHGRIRNLALLMTSCRLCWRWASLQPTKCSRALSFYALAPKLSKVTRRSPAKML